MPACLRRSVTHRRSRRGSRSCWRIGNGRAKWARRCAVGPKRSLRGPRLPSVSRRSIEGRFRNRTGLGRLDGDDAGWTLLVVAVVPLAAVAFTMTERADVLRAHMPSVERFYTRWIAPLPPEIDDQIAPSEVEALTRLG